MLFLVPPVRLDREEFDFVIHWPRHALVMAAELGSEWDCTICDVTIEFAEQDRSQISEEELAAIVRVAIDRAQPDVIALHAHAGPHFPLVIKVLAAIRATGFGGVLVIGGMLAAQLPQLVAAHAPPGAWIFRGEATGRTQQLFAVLRGAPRPFWMRIEDRERSVRIVDVLSNPEVIDYPSPDFDLLPMERYQRLSATGAFVPHLELSSGCTYKCAFCGVHYPEAKGRFRRRPVQNVLDELATLVNRYGLREFYFCDETFSLDREAALDLCRAISRDLPGIRWRCVTRVDHMDDELADAMAAAGCFEVGFGVETGDDAVLKRIAKQSTADRNRRAIELVQSRGMTANALTVIGLPHETHASIRRTFEFLARDARPRQVQVFIFTPVPGTIYFDHPERFGLRIDTRDPESWYDFDHIAQPVCDTAHLTRADVVRYFLLFCRALPTIVDPTPDPVLIKRILENRFPVRLAGVTWLNEGDRLRLYCPRAGSGSVMDRTLEVKPQPGAPSVDAVEFVLTLASGALTRDEIGSAIAGRWGVGQDEAKLWTGRALDILTTAGALTEF